MSQTRMWSPVFSTESRVVEIADSPDGTMPTPAHCGPSSAISVSWNALVVGVPWRP
ncbi:hypothetical protein ABIE87_006213 [Bradyrhizobium diazoefficiens]